MTFHTALRQLKPSLITAHLLQQRGILVMWFNKYVCIQRSTYLMSLTAQGNSHLPAKIKKPNLHATRTHVQTHTYMWKNLTTTKEHCHMHMWKNAIHSHRMALTPHTHTRAHRGTNTYKHHNNLFFKKRREQMIQMKGAKLRVGMCLHSLTTFWRCYQGGNQTTRLL